MKTLSLAVILVSVLLCSVALAVDPESTPQETKPPPDLQRTEPEGGPLPFPEQMIVGMVTGADDKPIGGVAIKLFADGRIVEVSHTTSAGDYEIPMPLDVEKDETVVIWFTDSAGTYPPQEVLIKESSKAREAHLISKCTRAVKMRPQIRVDIKLMTDSQLMDSYKASGCLD
jgi:hypothetical protein